MQFLCSPRIFTALSLLIIGLPLTCPFVLPVKPCMSARGKAGGRWTNGRMLAVRMMSGEQSSGEGSPWEQTGEIWDFVTDKQNGLNGAIAEHSGISYEDAANVGESMSPPMLGHHSI